MEGVHTAILQGGLLAEGEEGGGNLSTDMAITVCMPLGRHFRSLCFYFLEDLATQNSCSFLCLFPSVLLPVVYFIFFSFYFLFILSLIILSLLFFFFSLPCLVLDSPGAGLRLALEAALATASAVAAATAAAAALTALRARLRLVTPCRVSMDEQLADGEKGSDTWAQTSR